jgi:hypothetical protein
VLETYLYLYVGQASVGTAPDLAEYFGFAALEVVLELSHEEQTKEQDRSWELEVACEEAPLDDALDPEDGSCDVEGFHDAFHAFHQHDEAEA